MPLPFLLLLGLFGLGCATAGPTTPAAPAEPAHTADEADGFAPLFDGHSAAGWTGPVENYTFDHGVIACRAGKGGTIYTQKQYADFVAILEFKLSAGGNNGLAIRYPGYGDAAYSGMCELQVLDNTDNRYAHLDPRQYHGSAYGMAAAQRGHLKPAGEWNQQTVTVIGSTIRVELNGAVILDTDLAGVDTYFQDKPHPGKGRTRGHFGLAGHGDAVAYRNLFIKELTR